MEPSFTGMNARLSALKEQLDNLYAVGVESELQTCRSYGDQLLLHGTAVSSGDTSYDDQRDMIAGMRTAVHKLQENLEQVTTKYAEAYRTCIGSEHKEAFERLSAELQQQYNAEAYVFFSAFHKADRLLDELSHLNSALMDTGHRLEQTNRHSPEPATAGDRGRAAAEADVHRYDTDPVPPSLSP